MFSKKPISRRSLLKGLGISGAAFMMADFLPALATTPSWTESDYPIFIFCTFQGGWDQVLACDPRDGSDAAYGTGKAIDPGYDMIAGSDAAVDAAIAETGGSGIFTPAGSNISVGPTMTKLAGEHWEDLCVVRGIDMGTLTHQVGVRYFLTGKFPRGLQANGSSASSAFVGNSGEHTDIPNLVVGMETYNETFDHYANGVRLAQPTDVLAMVSPLSDPLSGNSAGAVRDYVTGWGCNDIKLDGEGAVASYLESVERADVLLSGELAQHFDFVSPDENTQAVMEHFGLNGNPGNVLNLMEGPYGSAFLGAQAITKGVSQSVSLRLAGNIDHHDDNFQTAHAPALREGFDALSLLISHLKNTQDSSGNPYWDRCVLLVSSDFARTPTFNSRGGKDHHLSSSCIVAGKGIRGNQVIGGTDESFDALPMDLTTGATGGSTVLSPPDVHATLLQAAGLSHDHLSNQSPQIVTAMLENA